MSGTATVLPGDTLTVVVDGVLYTAGDGNLVDNNDRTWTLSIPVQNALAENVFDVTASISDAAGNQSVDVSSNELLVDLTLPNTPTVESLLTNSATPTIVGQATVLAGEVLSVNVNGISYTAGDGSLVLNPDGTWALTIPANSALPEGPLNVVATVIDAAGNSASDATVNELLIDLTAPVMPSFGGQLENTSTPILSGEIDLQPGDVFTVTVLSLIHI